MKSTPTYVLGIFTLLLVVGIIFVKHEKRKAVEDPIDIQRVDSFVIGSALSLYGVPIWLGDSLKIFDKYGLHVDFHIYSDLLDFLDAAEHEKLDLLILEQNSESIGHYKFLGDFVWVKSSLVHDSLHSGLHKFVLGYNDVIQYMYSHKAEDWGYAAFDAFHYSKEAQKQAVIPMFHSVEWEEVRARFQESHPERQEE